MSTMPPPLESIMLALTAKRAELAQKNKQAAREQLLRIQLLLAKKTK